MGIKQAMLICYIRYEVHKQMIPDNYMGTRPLLKSFEMEMKERFLLVCLLPMTRLFFLPLFLCYS